MKMIVRVALSSQTKVLIQFKHHALFMLNPTEHELLTAHKIFNAENKEFCFQTLSCCIYHLNN